MSELRIKADEGDLRTRSTRRMTKTYQEYVQGERRPKPRSTLSDMGIEPEKLQRIVKHMTDPLVRIGPGGFAVPSDAGFGSFRGRDWTEDDLPVKGHGLKQVSGALLDIKTANEKLNLARVVPEFVMQMLLQAAEDYARLLRDAVRVVRMAAQDYASDLRGAGVLDVFDARLLKRDDGLAMLVGTQGFREFFDDWCQGTRTLDAGDVIQGAPPNVMKLLRNTTLLPKSRIQSAILLVSSVGTFDPCDTAPSSVDVAVLLGLDTKYEPEATRVQAHLIARDPWFRYFVDGTGGGSGSRVRYWDWVRDETENVGLYKGKWAQF